jgi:hypothetical protein
MSAIIPETCFQCGCLLDECVCQGDDEALATWTGKLVDAIWIRAQTSPL